jgi:transposase-like protein
MAPSEGSDDVVQVLGRYSNSTDATERLKRLARKAKSEHVDRVPRAISSRKVGKKLSPALQLAVVEAYESGTRFTDVARRFDLDESTVTKYLKLAGVARRSRSMSEEEKAEARRLFGAGLSIERISRQLGYAWRTVQKAVLETR